MKTTLECAILCLKSQRAYSSLWFLAFFFLLGCGVKGDPLPPEKPPLLGRGQPTYKKATEEISLPKPPQIIFEEEDEDEDESDNIDEDE